MRANLVKYRPETYFLARGLTGEIRKDSILGVQEGFEMIVSELIAKLQKLPQDAECAVYESTIDDHTPIIDVEYNDKEIVPRAILLTDYDDI